MRLKILILEWRMKLGLDPWARTAWRRHVELKSRTELIGITRKAIAFQSNTVATGTIIAQPLVEEDGAVILDMRNRFAIDPNKDLKNTCTNDDGGMLVVMHEPTDPETVALMSRYQRTIGNPVDSSPPPAIEWEGGLDPFVGINNLG